MRISEPTRLFEAFLLGTTARLPRKPVYVDPGLVRYEGSRSQHRMVYFKMPDGRVSFCDQGVLPLVRVLNRIPLVRCWASCEGDEGDSRGGYIMLLWAGTKRDLRRFFHEIAECCNLVRDFEVSDYKIPKKLQVGRFAGLPSIRGSFRFPAGAAPTVAAALTSLAVQKAYFVVLERL